VVVVAHPQPAADRVARLRSLLPPENIFVRFFVPEQMLAKVHYGERVKLLCDSCPAEVIATISFISPQAEYAPPVIYSETSRAKLVYRIEARPPAQQASLLNPGQPVAVRLLDRTARDDGFRH
jgi:HlyD family secretion protein